MKDLVKKTKGTVSQFSDDSLEFTPQGKGEPVYEHSYKVGEAPFDYNVAIIYWIT